MKFNKGEKSTLGNVAQEIEERCREIQRFVRQIQDCGAIWAWSP